VTQILRTIRRLPKETLEYEPFAGLDGQGSPSYDTPISFEANVLEYDPTGSGSSRGHQFVNKADGSLIRTPLTLYVAGDAASVPAEQDRITVDATNYIVMERAKVSGLRYSRNSPNHYRLRCRRE
jgi:hypothetical protein